MAQEMSEKQYGGLTLAQLRAIEQAATPGLWRPCGATGKTCKCGMVWAVDGDHPVATVVTGGWGDEYPALRFVDGNGEPVEGRSLSARAEAYTERIEYGSIPEAEGLANAQAIAAARNALPDLLAEIDRLEAMLAAIEEQSAEEEREALARYVPIQHGVTCKKEEHIRSGYLHSAEDDSPYDVDGMMYCGRCHVAI